MKLLYSLFGTALDREEIESKTVTLTPAVQRYILEHAVTETDTQRALRSDTLGIAESGMQISPDQGQLLRFLVSLMGVENAIEVGVFTGYSALCIASALPEHGRLLACDVSEAWTGIAKPFWTAAGVADRIDLRIGPARDTLNQVLASEGEGQFDFAFIDADKTNYAVYYEQCLQLLRPGGLMAFDNMLWGGSVADATRTDPDTVSLRDLSATLKSDPRVEYCLLTVGDGVGLVRKR
ncbi:MAG: class I SAM-dependent methyltransferase [Pseudomonadota bacterium]